MEKYEHKTLLFLIGIPASGKSTLRKTLMDEQSAVFTNKDMIRDCLASEQNIKSHKVDETLVVEKEMDFLRNLMTENHPLIVCDNTHLHVKHLIRLKTLCKEFGYIFQEHFMEDSFNVELCHRRNLLRKEQVPVYVIENMSQSFYGMYFEHKLLPSLGIKRKKPLEDAIIVDLDGTVCKMVNRHAFDWKNVGNDLPHEKIIDLVRYYHGLGYKVIITSGRDAVCRPQTIEWLKRYNVPYDELHMRAENDCRKDTIVKMELYAEHIYPFYNVHIVLDDRNCVCLLWRGLGLTCLQVASGYF